MKLPPTKKLVAAVFGVFALLALVTVLLNRAQPSEQDRSVGIALAASAKRAISSDKEQVLFEASRDRVFINAYGFSDAAREDKLLMELKSQLGKERYHGRRTSTVKKADATGRFVLAERVK